MKHSKRMAIQQGVDMTLTSFNMRYDGLNKYFTVRGSNVYHSDKYCYHLDNSVVRMVESHEISHMAEACDHCTVKQPQFKSKRPRLI